MSYCTIIFPLFFITRTIRCSITNIPSTYLQNSWKLIFPCCFVLSLKGLLGTLVQSPDWVSKYGTKTKHFGDPVSGQIHGFICHSASWLLKQELGCRIFLINGEKNESVSQISRVISIKKNNMQQQDWLLFSGIIYLPPYLGWSKADFSQRDWTPTSRDPMTGVRNDGA